MNLTTKREAFATGLASGLSQAEAYRRAYPRSCLWQEKTLWSRASELAADAKVRARVAELQESAAKVAVFTLADHLKRLDDLARAAEKAGKFDAAIKAEENRGRAAGFYTSKVEMTGQGGGPIETRQTRDLTDEELAAELAKYGLSPDDKPQRAPGAQQP